MTSMLYAQEETSFYGQRSVGIPAERTEEQTWFYRRYIAPAVKPETQEIPENIHNKNAVNSSQQVEQYTLSRNELLIAKKANYYFARNRRVETGFWDSVQGYSHTTMWDLASGIASVLASEALGLKTSRQALYELQKMLSTLLEIPLYDGKLPNREYSTKTGQPTGKLSDTPSNGNGWSALDIGRLLIWFKILIQQHPDLADDVFKITSKWDLSLAINNGTLFGTKLYKGREYYRQEGRNGYLQYAAYGFTLFNHSVPLPDLKKYISYVEVDGSEIAIDIRNVPFLTSDPYVLAGLEYGEDPTWSQLKQFYRLHKDKWQQNGVLTSYAEDAMSKNPWFAYNNIFYYGKPWTSVSPSGKPIENPQTFSNKVAFGFSALFNDSFSQQLFNKVLEDSLNHRSIPTGTYANNGANSSYNINTNSMILVALWYKANGFKPILSP
ncbi:DUF3131 domain-containing protein [Vibrio tetraodonis]|uniref:DUF3131 domain-containing protein n=1 Tax=Vibrio tetraodonis TaxID=2231647 RepID=UPI000E0C8996|nr:DUF3131 domain-containing protein [Vibrio tetraodonis]